MTEDDLLERRRRAIKRWRADPVAWFRDVLGVDLEGGWWSAEGQRAYQAEILRSIVDNRETYVVSGNSVGKDWVFGRVVLWWMTTRKGARVVTTAAKEQQITTVLWSELRAGYAEAEKRGFPMGGTLMPAKPFWEIKSEVPPYMLLGRAFGQVAADQNAFHGIHGPNVLILGDEAAGLAPWMPEAADGMAVGPRDRIVWFGNPTCAPDHPFARQAMSPDVPGKKKTIRVKGTDTPNVVQGREVIRGLQTVEGVEAIVRKHGRNGAVTKARVGAEFPISGADSLIGYQHTGPAQARWDAGVRGKVEDVCRAGGDVARYGDDNTALAWVRGCEGHVDHRDVRGGLSVDQVTDFFGNRCREVGAAGISIDGGAMGAGPIDYLRRDCKGYGLRGSFYVSEVLFGAKAHDEETYADKRTELWFNLRDWLAESGSIDIDPELEEELLAPTYTYVGRRYKLERKEDTKKRLGKSPDRADALALAVAGHIGYAPSLVLTGYGQAGKGADAPQTRPTRDWDDEDAPDPLRRRGDVDGFLERGGRPWEW